MKLSVRVDDAVTLNVRHRPGGGRPFVLLHGLGSNARMWDEIADRLEASGHPVYAPDLRGHGESDVPGHGYDNATAVADVAEVCRHLRLSGFLLAGHSWGANLAVRLAAEHPGLAAGLALVDGGWIRPDAAVDGASLRDKGAANLGWWGPGGAGTTRATMRNLLRALHPAWSPAAVEASLADLAERPDGTLVPRLPMEHHISIGLSMLDDPPARWYPSVKVPVLLLIALSEPSWEPWVRTWVAQAEAAMPQTESRWYPDADHNLHADHPDRVADDLLDLARMLDKPPAERC